MNIKIRINDLHCPVCCSSSFVSLCYDDEQRLYYFKCDHCNLQTEAKFSDAMNLFKNFNNLKWVKK